MKRSKIKSLFIIFIIYGISIVGSLYLYKFLPINDNNFENILLKLFICDIVATLIVFIGSLIFDNSSIYDPYWSVAPVVLCIGFINIVNNVNAYSIIIVSLVILWSIRLTTNCIYNFQNLMHQDWRYQMYKESNPKTYWIISLFGFHLMPTLVVFIALVPCFMFIINVGTTLETIPTAMTIVSFAVILTAIIIETIADIELIKFKNIASNNGLVMDTKLRKISRHPNYFGECLFWFGLFLAYYSFPNSNLLLVTSPLIVFLLFEFISIPMMDKHELERKPAYKEYMEKTNPMLPFFPPHNEK